MKPLDNDTLAEIATWDAERLFWRFERTCGLRACIQEQYANTSRPSKGPTDPDVAQMEVEYEALYDEILARIGNRYKGDLNDYVAYQVGWDRHLARIRGAFGMSEPATGIDWDSWKVTLATHTANMLTLLGVGV
jgi:hypothetical protein